MQMRGTFIILLVTLYLLSLSCSADKSNENQPGFSFMPGDKRFSVLENFLADGSVLRRYLEDNNLYSNFFWDMVADQDSGDIYLLGFTGELVKFTSDGIPVWGYKKYGEGPGEMIQSKQLKVRDGKVYVWEQRHNKICIFTTLGKWIRDVSFREKAISTFTVDDAGNILLTQLTAAAHSEEPLFYVYNENGDLIKKYASNSAIKEDLVNTPAGHIIDVLPDKTIALFFPIQARNYTFNEAGNLMSIFDLRNGPEWKRNEDWERKLAKESKLGKSWTSYFLDLQMNSKGSLYVAFNGCGHGIIKGELKGEFCGLFTFNSNGQFTGRVLWDKSERFGISRFAFANDSTLIVYGKSPDGDFINKILLHEIAGESD